MKAFFDILDTVEAVVFKLSATIVCVVWLFAFVRHEIKRLLK